MGIWQRRQKLPGLAGQLIEISVDLGLTRGLEFAFGLGDTVK